MFGSMDRVCVRDLRSPSRFALSSTAFAAIACFIEIVAIIATAIITGLCYHTLVYNSPGSIEQYADIGGLAGIAYTAIVLIRDEYSVVSPLEGRRLNSRTFMVWNIAFAGLAAVGFLTKSTGDFSRGWLLLFYFAGLVAVIALNSDCNGAWAL